MVRRALAAIRVGQCEVVLCVGAGTFPRVGAGAGGPMAAMVSHEEYEAPYGGFIPAYYALGASRTGPARRRPTSQRSRSHSIAEHGCIPRH